MDTNLRNYQTLFDATEDLKRRGYTYDFDYQSACLFCDKINTKFEAKDLKITEYYRFEGISDPDDNSIIYAIESTDGHKGIMIDAYGPYSDEHKAAFILSIPIES